MNGNKKKKIKIEWQLLNVHKLRGAITVLKAGDFFTGRFSECSRWVERGGSEVHRQKRYAVIGATLRGICSYPEEIFYWTNCFCIFSGSAISALNQRSTRMQFEFL